MRRKRSDISRLFGPALAEELFLRNRDIYVTLFFLLGFLGL